MRLMRSVQPPIELVLFERSIRYVLDAEIALLVDASQFQVRARRSIADKVLHAFLDVANICHTVDWHLFLVVEADVDTHKQPNQPRLERRSFEPLE
jgi:hypothetical protein